jgi:peptide-methionine (S)-S-oxide reductase
MVNLPDDSERRIRAFYSNVPAARSVITTGMGRLLVCAGLLSLLACADKKVEPPSATMNAKTPSPSASPSAPAVVERATFGEGCFWCVEAVFQDLKGVISVESGYSGGKVENPSYKMVCAGDTGHAEVCQITYDPSVVPFKRLLEVFWKTHDPTTPNRQGHDEGTQYRSVIFYHSPEQKSLAEKYKKELDASGAFGQPIVTEISPLTKFWKAEEYHQNYFKLNPDQGYCRIVIAPKVEKFRKVFGDSLK